MVKLEVGKFYKTRDGRKVGPVFMDGDNDPFVWFDQNGGCWAIDGEDGNAVGIIGSKTSGDIIAEWIEEPAMCEAECRGYKKVRVTKHVDGWPVGYIVWLDENSPGKNECWNDDCSKRWFHRVGVSCEYVNESPVRTMTQKEIVPGTYGRVRITSGGYVHVNSMKDASELRTAIATLTEIAEAMESK